MDALFLETVMIASSANEQMATGKYKSKSELTQVTFFNSQPWFYKPFYLRMAYQT